MDLVFATGYDTLYGHFKSLGYTDDYIRISEGLAAFDDIRTVTMINSGTE